MEGKLSRIITLFQKSPRFTIENKLADFEGRPNEELYFPEVNYEGLFSAYGEKPRDFRERVANLTNPQALSDYKSEPLNVNWITSVDVLAANSEKIKGNPFFQLAAVGVTVTRDNQIILGVRGGVVTPERIQQFASGLYGPVPGGSVAFKPKYDDDPITDTLRNEFHEEIGYFDIRNINVFGAFEAYRPGPTGIKFVGKIETDATLEQIQADNIRANKLEEELKSKGVLRKNIDLELSAKKLPTDAWEHLPMIGIPNSEYAIKRFVETQTQSLSGISEGALIAYIDFLSK